MVLVFTLIHFAILKIAFRANVEKMVLNIALISIPTAVMISFSLFVQKCSDHILWEFATIIMCVAVYVVVALMVKPIRKWISENEFTSVVYRKAKKVMLKLKK